MWAADHARAEIGKVPVAELAVADVDALLDRLAKHGLGQSSLGRIRLTLSMALDNAVRRGEAGQNVAASATLTPSATRRTTRRSLSPVEARALLAALHDERNGLMFALSLRLGLRPGESAGLLWSDIGPDTVNITHGLRATGNRVEVVDFLKVESARRTIALPGDLSEWFGRHRATQAAERLASQRWSDDRLVFASKNGTPLSPRNTRRYLSQICVRAGVTVISPNELRHSCASLLSDEGVPNELIADLLGHTTTRMVDQTYRHRLRPVVDVRRYCEMG